VDTLPNGEAICNSGTSPYHKKYVVKGIDLALAEDAKFY
jgi:hypothetical protein